MLSAFLWVNKMKITKQELYNIIKEEFAAVLEQDAQGMFARGAKGAGADEISVEKIRIAPDGSFKARLSSAAMEKPIRVALLKLLSLKLKTFRPHYEAVLSSWRDP